MIVPVMAISNLVLTRQIYSEETNGAPAHYREPVPLKAYYQSSGNIKLFPRPVSPTNEQFFSPQMQQRLFNQQKKKEKRDRRQVRTRRKYQQIYSHKRPDKDRRDIQRRR